MLIAVLIVWFCLIMVATLASRASDGTASDHQFQSYYGDFVADDIEKIQADTALNIAATQANQAARKARELAARERRAHTLSSLGETDVRVID